MRLLGYLLFGWFLVVCILGGLLWITFSDPPTEQLCGIDSGRFQGLLIVFMFGLLLAGLLRAAQATGRYVRFVCCCCNERYYLDRVVDLDSAHETTQRRALFAVADYHGDPFGIFGWRLLPRLTKVQLAVLVGLHQHWLFAGIRDRAAVQRTGAGDVGRPCEPDSPQCKTSHGPLRRTPDSHVDRTDKDPAIPPVPLPALEWATFRAALEERIQETLGQAAAAINAAPNEEVVSASARRVVDLFTALQQEALSLGLLLRLLAAGAQAVLAIEFERGTPPLSAADKLRQVRLRVDEILDFIADKIKEVTLDSMIAEAPGRAMAPKPLPPLDPQRFGEAMMGPVEQVLREVLRLVNAAPSGEVSPPAELLVRGLFRHLERQALEIGLEMRLPEWEADLPAPLRPEPSSGAAVPLRKAANPSLPASQASQVRWGDKFRRMRVAGTVWPLGNDLPES